jgi:hypothetical protein
VSRSLDYILYIHYNRDRCLTGHSARTRRIGWRCCQPAWKPCRRDSSLFDISKAAHSSRRSLAGCLTPRALTGSRFLCASATLRFNFSVFREKYAPHLKTALGGASHLPKPSGFPDPFTVEEHKRRQRTKRITRVVKMTKKTNKSEPSELFAIPIYRELARLGGIREPFPAKPRRIECAPRGINPPTSKQPFRYKCLLHLPLRRLFANHLRGFIPTSGICGSAQPGPQTSNTAAPARNLCQTCSHSSFIVGHHPPRMVGSSFAYHSPFPIPHSAIPHSIPLPGLLVPLVTLPFRSCYDENDL